MHSVFALGVLAIAGLSAAQEQFTIDPNTVTETNRRYWCEQQKAACPLICLQLQGVDSMTTSENDCEWETLDYSCVCSNNASPDMKQWSQTVPFFICQQWGITCVANCAGNTTCQSKCTADHPCGAQQPYKGNGTLAITTSATKTSSATGTDIDSTQPTSGFDDSDTSKQNTDDEGSAAPLNLGHRFGLAVVLGGLVAGFAIIL